MRFVMCAFIFLLLFPLVLSTSSSENYNVQTSTTSGGDNVSSASYKHTVVVGVLGGFLNSSTYQNHMGLMYTIRLASGQLCSQDSQCEGGYCCSGTCRNSACPAAEDSTPSPDPQSGGGGGAGSSGGGGGGFISPQLETPGTLSGFDLSPQTLRIHATLSDITQSTLLLSNNGTTSLNISLRILNVEDFVTLFPSHVELAGLEQTEIDVDVLGRRLGSYLGKIVATTSEQNKSSTLLIDVGSDVQLLDVRLDIPPSFKWIGLGQQPRAQLSIFNIGAIPQTEATITYFIKNSQGIVMSEESETFIVEDVSRFAHEFSSNNLDLGTYLAIAEVRYGESFAVSSDLFEVVEKEESQKIFDIPLQTIALFLAAIIVLGLLVRYVRKQKRKERKNKKKERPA